MDYLNYALYILYGLPQTLSLVLIAMLVGTGIALLLCLVLLSNSTLVTIFVRAYATFFRSTPLYVQLLLAYHGVGYYLGPILIEQGLVELDDPFYYSLIALMCNTSAYTQRIFESAINSVPRQYIQVASALGLSRWQIFKYIIAKNAVHYAWPSYGNEIILNIKGSALVAAIGVMDMMGRTIQIAQKSYDLFSVYAVSGVIYLVLNIVMVYCLGQMVNRYCSTCKVH